MKNRKWTKVELIKYYNENVSDNPEKMSIVHKNWYNAIWYNYKDQYAKNIVKSFINDIPSKNQKLLQKFKILFWRLKSFL